MLGYPNLREHITLIQKSTTLAKDGEWIEKVKKLRETWAEIKALPSTSLEENWSHFCQIIYKVKIRWQEENFHFIQWRGKLYKCSPASPDTHRCWLELIMQEEKNEN